MLVIWVLGSVLLAAVAQTSGLDVDAHQALAVTGYSSLPLLLAVALLVLTRPSGWGELAVQVGRGASVIIPCEHV